jgi:hypothetical protein
MHTCFVRCLLLFPVLALAAGCSQTGTVSGKIYYKGKPVEGGTVFFWPEGKDGSYPAIIGLDGSYSVSKLPPGPAKISVVPGATKIPPGATQQVKFGRPDLPGKIAKGLQQVGRMGRGRSGSEEQSGSAVETKKERAKDNFSLPEKYTNPEKSGLTINVTGGKQTHDIHLE